MKSIYSTFSRLFMLLFLVLGVSSIYAQHARISGQVKDPSGAPLQGATVQLKGTKIGTVSDVNGAYTLSAAPGKYTLTTSFVGFSTQEIEITLGQNGLTQDVALVNTGDLSTVTVVGSRNVSRTRIETPVPVDVIPIAQVVNDVGQVDLNQIINFVAPSFQSARQTIADGTDHVDPGQLRGLGPDQVLVLINGKRRHQSALVNVNGTVNRGTVGTDMSAIPATAIERIEILRDGASAQYGSDAIAGVINIVLKKRTGLLEANASYGMYSTSYDKNFPLYKLTNKADDPSVHVTDGETFQGSLGYGFSLGKGYLNITGEYIRREPTNRTGTYTGPVYPNVNGVNKDDSIMAARGLNRDFFDMRIGNSKMNAGGAFYNFAYPVSGKTEIYLFGGYTRKDGTGAGFYRYPSGIPTNATIYASQAFALYPNGFLPRINSEITDFSTAVGVRTKLGQWNMDISNTFGLNRFNFIIDNSVNYTQFAIPGNKQTKFDAGGLKFWQNTANLDLSKKYDVLAGLNVAAGLEYRIDAFGINSGEEASYKNYDVSSKAVAGAQVFAGFVNSIGDDKTRNAKAVYLDLEQDFTNKFLLTGALRFEDYSDFGSTLNYKLAARYKFSEQFNLRASTSSGFRAPSMQQRFYAKTNTLFVSQGGTLVPVESGTFTNESEAAKILGIPELKEETSQNYSVGLTTRPFTGFELTVDAYQINIDNRIVLTNNFTGGNDPLLQAELDKAGAGAANFFTNAIDTRSKGLEAVLTYNTSIARKHALRTVFAATFIDNEVKKGPDGKPIIHATDILINSGQIGNYFNREDQSRIEVANPKNKFSLMFNYKYNKLGAMLRFVRFGKVEYLDPTINPDSAHKFPINAFTGQRETLDQTFSEKTVTDLSLSYDITSYLGFTIGANNLFNVYQDKHTHSGNVSLGRFIYSRRVQQMGFNGAYYFARLRLSLPTK
ncbi:TonB-dependent receptor [Flavisolibacter tropicus]|uniref:TonB-dependent receptor n=1 Tax=Flavisolibacter tropicus TaxID=1492898 RepID=A0A172U1K5_9BACT|nr:TonB-dependent receptor [Flavisolibacter tropicus]ANE52887.1 TonB-dependent receptor [Flavisolibacter tropicus]